MKINPRYDKQYFSSQNNSKEKVLMGARENKVQISQELLKKKVKLSCIRFRFVKFEAFKVCFLGLSQEPFVWSYFL